MIARQGSQGRVFVLRLEDGDRMPSCLEQFAAENGIESALAVMLGGVGAGRIVVGPEDGTATPITPMLHQIADVCEVAALGTLFPDAAGKPVLHMHAALGRGDETHTGCIRPGIEVWKIAEVVVLEILGTGLSRVVDAALGATVLDAAGPPSK